jgi:hypothetical protein
MTLSNDDIAKELDRLETVVTNIWTAAVMLDGCQITDPENEIFGKVELDTIRHTARDMVYSLKDLRSHFTTAALYERLKSPYDDPAFKAMMEQYRKDRDAVRSRQPGVFLTGFWAVISNC